MEAYEKRKKEEEKNKKRTNSYDDLSKLPPPKEVPDFKRLHKEFAARLDKNKSSTKLTDPKPFTFHEPKSRVDLRKHMDDENQKIQPTMKKRASSVKFLNADLETNPVNPSTTKKHEALVKLRRDTKIKKMNEKN